MGAVERATIRNFEACSESDGNVASYVRIPDGEDIADRPVFRPLQERGIVKANQHGGGAAFALLLPTQLFWALLRLRPNASNTSMIGRRRAATPPLLLPFLVLYD